MSHIHMNESIGFSNQTNHGSNVVQSRTIIFSLIIVLAVPSIICSIFLFVQFAQRYHLRRKPINLLVFSLILITFFQKLIEMPLTLYFLHENRVVHQSRSFCQFWNIIQYSLGSSLVWITMFCSIERYLYVFHGDFLRRHFIFLRIIPLISSLVHPLILNLILIFIAPPCQSTFHYNRFMCGFPCYAIMDFWSTYVWNIHVGLPILIVIFSNTLLVGRVLIHKTILQQSGIWLRVVKLIIQIISIALLDISAWMPMYITVQIHRHSKQQSFHIFMEYFVYLPYLVINLCPFMCLIGLHELHKPIKQFLSKCLSTQ